MSKNIRPDYVTCILTGLFNDKHTWCQRDLSLNSEFYFTDPSHALLHAHQMGRLLICPECSNKLKTILNNSTYVE
jgi:hypothetical protein